MSKKILITGSTDGIGKLTAIKLAKEGHSVYIHGRNANKLKATLAEIKEVSKNENIAGFVADFSDLKAVKQMAEQISNELSAIDVLINNAGIYNSPQPNNKDGLDMRMVVNYFAPYVLTNALLPSLKKGADARIINLSSAAQSSVSMDVLKGDTAISDSPAYAQSKLALTMWSFYLAEKEPDLRVIAVNPGSLLNTKMVKEAFGRHYAEADKGANILYNLAVSEKYKDETGKYFDNDKGSFAKAHQDAYDLDEIKQLIRITEKVTK